MVSDNLLSFAANNYGFDKGTLHFISDSTNQIYSRRFADQTLHKDLKTG